MNHLLFRQTSYFVWMLLFGGMLWLGACSQGKKEEEIKDPATAKVTPRNARKVLTLYGEQNKEDLVLITTPFGNMKARLYATTPLHRANFIRQVKNGFFDNADFHRIIKGFMVQAGYADKRSMKLDTFLIPHEIDPQFFHKKGALAMAHHDRDKGSSPYDFYIVHGTVFTKDSLKTLSDASGHIFFPDQIQTYTTLGGAPHLDSLYTVFGEVVEGLNIVDSIANVPADVKAEKPLQKIPIQVRVIGKSASVTAQ